MSVTVIGGESTRARQAKEHKYGLTHLILRACLDYFRAAKGWAAVEQGVAVLQALSWTAAIIATQRLFDTITIAANHGLGFQRVVAPLGVLAVVVVLQQILSGAESYIFTYNSYGNSGKFMADFQRKLNRVPAALYEDAEFLDEVEQSRECLEYESLGVFTAICLNFLTSYAVFFAALGVFLFRLSPLLPLVIIAAFIPAALSLFAKARVFAELEEDNAPLRRRYEFYQDAIASREFFKETRLLGGFNYFYRLFIQTLGLITENRWQAERKTFWVRLALNVVSFLGLGAATLLLFQATMSGSISVGAFVAVFAGLTQMFSLMSEIVTERFSEASEYVGQIKQYYQLMDMPEVGGRHGKPDFIHGIRAQNVSFTYPGAETPAVINATLEIEDGETVAIVGENGAGKSTLVRLLSGLYQPDKGSVMIGGLDSADTHPETLYRETSGVFQKYQRYKMTLGENVAISNTLNPPDAHGITKALTDAHFNKGGTPLDTMLSPEFGGIDLSGGQWQRLAIARGLYRANQFIVLDEPTAAIDPLEEAHIYQQFEQLAQGKCAIIVTHRLGSVKLADRIVVMDSGEIKDIGTHAELLSRQGKYAQMWAAQAAWYENR
ncbi:MAG: ABC transporter ATP-binding protein/permease [Cellulomonadaceae bacterium]|jgi:ATP-binding cassette subfamily B protein|nr:ABC transporter ATP-binding protein/permease [Cellulomonadaceae bacterium]